MSAYTPRLVTYATDLTQLLERADEAQLRRVAALISGVALNFVSLTDPRLNAAQKAIADKRFGLSPEMVSLKAFVDHLDEVACAVQGRRHLAAFARARAANSLLFALHTDSFLAATEAVYEANAAIEDLEKITAAVEAVMDA